MLNLKNKQSNILNYKLKKITMNKKIIFALSLLVLIFTTSCGTKKKIAALEKANKDCQDLLNSTTVKLNLCLSDKQAMSTQLDFLKKNNSDLINNMGNMTTLTTQGATNIEKALETIKEKDLKITRMQDALTKKDSVTLALVTSLKSSVISIQQSSSSSTCSYCY